jgi:hypothetical protein
MRFDGPRLSFTKKAPGDALPSPLTAGVARHRTLSAHQPIELLRALPGPGEATHALIDGRQNLMTLLAEIARRFGPVGHLRMTTLAFNAKCLHEMAALLDEGAVKRMTLLASLYFRRHYKELWAETRQAFHSRGQRCAAARSHCKIQTFEFADGRRLTLSGSANLRSNGNAEAVTLIDGPQVHDWATCWIDQLVTAHEGEEEKEG